MNSKSRICLILIGVLWIMGCSRKELAGGSFYKIYYINASETRIELTEHLTTPEYSAQPLTSLLNALCVSPDPAGLKAPLNMGFSLVGYSLEDGKILLNMDAAYLDLTPTTEILIRAALVLTLTQDPDINFVGITVEGNTLFDNLNNVVGWMNADQFINNSGSEINNYIEETITLYFTNESGDQLISTHRTKRYSSNISMEKLVVEELIKGPGKEGVYPTINPATQIISVTVKDGICYVNLDDNFLTRTNNVREEITIYSIVNSLAELGTVNKVQIIINDNSAGIFQDQYSFNTIYERNLDLITTPETTQ
ncbi:MAG: GerMN domain-containing protein [Lachnospiraceae bacterium]|nr:GerMN domain-containing protein [Lachnospiraceae bacterium]